ncbi:sigma-54-dependent Fis family transcriptional regulator [bacterium]|nr:MAG: sigma-54-dependent Fis family transcriptional regulator [bacterium]
MRKYTILIIDDDSLFLALIKRHFEKKYRVLTAKNCKEGLAAASNERIDVAFLDQQLPDGCGIDLCPRILEANEQTKIILITGFPNIEQVVDAVKKGVFDYLCKPVELAELEIRVDQALRAISLEKIECLQKYSAEAEIKRVRDQGDFIGLDSVRELIGLAARSDVGVMITGETGTGKNVVAKAIHYRSSSASGPFVNFNCAAVPETLIESELFGYEKGSFTSAGASKKGIFEMAEGGTIFLDEIGDMPLHLQPKLLGVLDERKVRRLGGERDRQLDVRIVAATNVDLKKAVEEKTFRSDLYHRLNVLSIQLPSLRERKEEIEILALSFLGEFSKNSFASLENGEGAALRGYGWPGNVRELRNVVERAVLVQSGPAYRLSPFLAAQRKKPAVEPELYEEREEAFPSLEEVERKHIRRALELSGGNLTRASRVLGISLSTMKRKAAGYGLR